MHLLFNISWIRCKFNLIPFVKLVQGDILTWTCFIYLTKPVFKRTLGSMRIYPSLPSSHFYHHLIADYIVIVFMPPFAYLWHHVTQNYVHIQHRMFCPFLWRYGYYTAIVPGCRCAYTRGIKPIKWLGMLQVNISKLCPLLVWYWLSFHTSRVYGGIDWCSCKGISNLCS